MTNSTDIVRLVESLRFLASKKDGGANVSRAPSSTLIEAADLIQSQQALIEEMRGSMRDMADIIERAYDSGEMVDGGDLRYWVQLFRFAIERSKSLSQKDQIDG